MFDRDFVPASGLRRARVAIPVLLSLWCALRATAAVEPLPPPPPPAHPVVLLTRHALDGAGGTLADARIGVAEGRIRSLTDATPDAAVVDLRAYTVLPGWIDTHVHLDSHFDRSGRINTPGEPAAEAAMGIAAAGWDTLMGGVTTVQTVGDPSEKPLRDAIRERGFPGPRVLTSLAWIEGGQGLDDDALRALVAERRQQGADLVKIMASASQREGAGPTFSAHQLRVLCDSARASGLRSMVHAYGAQVAVAARAGCGQIEHMTYASEADIRAAAAAGAWLSPQVGLVVQNYIAHQARYIGAWNYTEQGMQTMLRDMPGDFRVCRLAATLPGAKLVFSTDATAGAHGRNAEEFIGRVEHCGQTPMEALVSANARAAEAIGMGDRLGRLAPGFEADIIALDGDPLVDVRAVRQVVFVMRGGVVYKWQGVPMTGRTGGT